MAFLDLFFTKGGRGGRPNAFKYLRPVTLIIVIVIIVFIDKGDCNSDDDNCDARAARVVVVALDVIVVSVPSCCYY